MIEKIKKIKIVSVIIIIGAVLACSAPFAHMFYPNTKNIELSKVKKEYKEKKIDRTTYINLKRDVTYFGYQNIRKFLYAIGKPISMLYFALLLLYSSFYIGEKQIKSIIRFGAILGVLVSFYFIVWAFWYRADFPVLWYYITIGVISISSTVMSYGLIKSRNSILSKIRLLTNHIVIKGKRHVPDENKKEYIKDYLETFNKLID
jgi:hypothetical protein